MTKDVSSNLLTLRKRLHCDDNNYQQFLGLSQDSKLAVIAWYRKRQLDMCKVAYFLKSQQGALSVKNNAVH